MFARHLLESIALRDDVLDLAVRLNWYRSLPLSCVEELAVSLDGVPLDAARTTVELDGVRCTVAELADADDRWWHVRDAGRVRVALDDPPSPGRHVVDLRLGSRIPYLVSPAGEAVVIVDSASGAVTR